MPTMKSVRTAAPGTIEVAEIRLPAPGPRDLLVRVRACGICGTDAAQQRFSRLISHHVPFSDAGRAFQLALTPGAAEKVTVTFDA